MCIIFFVLLMFVSDDVYDAASSKSTDFSPVRSGLMSFWSRFQPFHLIPIISCEMFYEF